MADLASLVVKVDSRDIKRAQDALSALGIQAKSTEKATDSMANSARKAGESFGGLRAALAGVGAIAAARAFVAMSDEITQVNSRLLLVISATEDFTSVQQRVLAISRANLQSYSATATLYGKLTPAIRGLGKGTQDALEVTDAFGKALRIGGANATEAASATLQFSQALASGVLRGEEFNAIAEVSPRILKAIADGSGFAAGQLRKLAADGVLTASVVSNALQSQLGVLEREAKGIAPTVGGSFQVLRDSVALAAEKMDKAAGVTDALRAAMTGLAGAVNAVAAIAVPALESFRNVLTTTTGPIGAIKDVLVAAAGGAAAFALAISFGPAVQIATIAITGLVFQLRLATAGMSAAAVATGALRGALQLLAANPIVALMTAAGAALAFYTNRVDRAIEESEREKAAYDKSTSALKNLNDERERLKRLESAQGAGVSEAAAQQAEERTKALEQIRKELEGTKNANQAYQAAVRVYDENAAARQRLAQASRDQAKADEAAKKAAEDAAKAAARLAAYREGLNNEIADQIKINGLRLDGMVAEEATLRVELARNGATKYQIGQKIQLLRETNAINDAEAEAARLAELRKGITDEESDLLEAQLLQKRTAYSFEEALYIKQRQRLGLTYDEAVAEVQNRTQKEAMLKLDQDRENAIKSAADTIANIGKNDFGANLAFGFDKASQSLGQLIRGLQTFAKIDDEVSKQTQANALLLAEKKIDQAQFDRNAANIAKNNAKAQIGAYADMVGAAKGFFKEGSKGYKALQAAEQTFRLFQIAMTAKELAVKLGALSAGTAADTAATGVEVANAAARATADGVAAQAKALSSAPPPANFAVLAAVTAALVGIGVALNGSGGGSGPGFTDNTGTGTVLGDAGKQSDSAIKAIDLLTEAAVVGNRIASGMLSSLKNIDANIGGLAASIVRAMPGANLAAGVQTKSVGLGTLGFGTSVKITGQGLTADAKSLGEIMSGGFDLNEFIAIQKKKKRLGMTVGGSFRIETSAASKELTSQFGRIFAGFADALTEGAKALDAYGKDFNERLQSFVVDIGMVDLKGLNGAEIQEKLTAVFSQQLDRLTSAAFPGIEKFQRVGEGLAQTLGRVVAEVTTVDTAFAKVGLSIASLRGSLDTLVTGVENIIAGAGDLDRLQAGLDTYFSEFLTDSERAANLTRQLGQEFNALGLTLPANVQAFRALVESQDLSTEAGQRLYGAIIALAPAFDQAAKAAAAAAAAAQKSADDAVAEAEARVNAARQAVEAAKQALRAAYDREIAALNAVIAKREQAADALRQAFQREASVFEGTIRQFDELANRLGDFIQQLTGQIADVQGQSYAELQRRFADVARRARLGDVQALGELPTVGADLAGRVADNASTAQDAARELARIRRQAVEAQGTAIRQKTIAEQQLDELREQVESLVSINDAVQTVAEAIVALQTASAAALAAEEQKAKLTEQVGKLIDIDESVLSVADGIKNLDAAQRELASAIRALAAAALTQKVTGFASSQSSVAQSYAASGGLVDSRGATATTAAEQAVANAYRDVLGRQADVGGLAYYANSGLSEAEIRAQLAASPEAQARALGTDAQQEFNRLVNEQIGQTPTVQYYATGGMHSGGWRVVGENGPELEYTGPSRIFNNGQTSSMLDMSGMQAELASLREDMKAAMWSVAKSTLRTADRLDRWDDGDRMNVRIDNEADDPALVRTVA